MGKVRYFTPEVELRDGDGAGSAINRGTSVTSSSSSTKLGDNLDSQVAEARFKPNSKMRLILYQRDDCHLCDQALAVLAAAHVPDFESVFIDDDAQLESRYGERVPVLRLDEAGCELNWPFDASSVRAFIAANP